MDYQEAFRIYEWHQDPFDLINQVSVEARPDDVREWGAYEEYRSAYSTAWAAMMGDEADVFDEDSPLDGLAYGAFTEGWTVAIMRVGKMLGVNPEVFMSAISLAGETGLDVLSQQGIESLRSVRPMEPGLEDIGRYFGEVMIALKAESANAPTTPA